MFPFKWSLAQIIRHAFAEILVNQHKILENQEKTMAVLDDVKAKVAKLKTDVEAFIAANSGGASDADLQALGASVDEIDAIVNPPAPAA